MHRINPRTLSGRFGQRPGVEGSPARNKDILAAVQLIRYGRVSYVPDVRMPQRYPVARAERKHVADRVPGERQSRIRRQNPRTGPSPTEVVRPAGFSGLVVNRFEHCLSVDSVIRTGPAILAVLGLGKIDAVAVPRANEEESRPRIKTRRAII